MTPALSYQDITLIPRYSELRSRSKADLSVEFLGRRFQLPAIPANMQSVLNEEIACWLSQNDYPYIFHRFSDTLEFVKKANAEKWKLVSISVGVKDEDKTLLREIAARDLQVDWICVDVAHGHHVSVKEMIEFIKGLKFRSSILDNRNDWSTHPIGYQPKIIAGNVATPDAVRDLSGWGADCVKIGIAQGRACRTYNQTGFGLPMFSCVRRCVEQGGPMVNVSTLPNPSLIYDTPTKTTIPLILDGGARENGDIAKALVAAQDVPALVMAGGLFAACIDAPGDTIYAKIRHPKGHLVDNKTKPLYKVYHGSASETQKQERRHVEGVQIEIPCNGLTYAEKYQEIRESLASSVSYAGGRDLSCLRSVEWMSLK